MATLDLFSEIKIFLVSLGINEHYNSMSRGVIDTRDLVYFISLSSIFIAATSFIVQSRKW